MTKGRDPEQIGRAHSILIPSNNHERNVSPLSGRKKGDEKLREPSSPDLHLPV